MARSRSKFLCRRCECAVVPWRGNVWKHCAGGNVRSCGKPPLVVEREAHETEMAEMVTGMKEALRDRLSSR